MLSRAETVRRTLPWRPFPVVADQRDPLDARVASVRLLGDFLNPIDLGEARSGRRSAEARERFGEHKNTNPPLPFVFVIDPLRMLLRCRNRHARLADELHRKGEAKRWPGPSLLATLFTAFRVCQTVTASTAGWAKIGFTVGPRR